MGLKLFKESNVKPHYFIVQVGAGANGSHFISSLCQDIATYGVQKTFSYHQVGPFEYTMYVCDADEVEKKNLKNQLFDEEDVGSFKVDALRERYSEHYNVPFSSVPQYVTDLEFFQKLFTFPKENKRIIPVLIGMVDNNRSRQLMDEFFHSNYLDDLIYIDAGVEGVYVVPGKEERQYSQMEKQIAANSGFSGQIVVGFKRNGQVFLPPVGRVFEDILTDEETAFPGQSCGEAIINNPQRCATNKFAAQIANNIMNTLFHTNEIGIHAVDFNAKMCGANPTYVSKDIQREYNALIQK